ncbi:hypothetical protein WM019_08925 [Bifidobacterium mongoliense]
MSRFKRRTICVEAMVRVNYSLAAQQRQGIFKVAGVVGVVVV